MVLAQGAEVTFIDRDLSAMSHIEHVNARKYQWDLEAEAAPSLPIEEYDIVLVFNYLHRPLLPQIAKAVKTEGLSSMKPFTQQAERAANVTPISYSLKMNSNQCLLTGNLYITLKVDYVIRSPLTAVIKYS